MSRIDSIDLASLRARLYWALDATRPLEKPEASLYLLVLGACFLACSHVREEEALQALYYTQAAAEDVDGDDTLSTIILAGGS